MFRSIWVATPVRPGFAVRVVKLRAAEGNHPRPSKLLDLKTIIGKTAQKATSIFKNR